MAGSTKVVSAPKVLRIELLSLDFGESAVIVEMEDEPPAIWLKAFKKELSHTEGLESAGAKFDGRFLYIVWVADSGRAGIGEMSRVLSTVTRIIEAGRANVRHSLALALVV